MTDSIFSHITAGCTCPRFIAMLLSICYAYFPFIVSCMIKTNALGRTDGNGNEDNKMFQMSIDKSQCMMSLNTDSDLRCVTKRTNLQK